LIYNAWLEAGKPSLTGISVNSLASKSIIISPNPFSGSASISFTLHQNTETQVQVLDITGKTKAILANGILEPNTYSFIWEAGNLPAGIYLVELKTPKSRQVKKLVLIN
jgi:hypothetical protein